MCWYAQVRNGEYADIFSNEKSILMLIWLMTLCISEKEIGVGINCNMGRELLRSDIIKFQSFYASVRIEQ